MFEDGPNKKKKTITGTYTDKIKVEGQRIQNKNIIIIIANFYMRFSH